MGKLDEKLSTLEERVSSALKDRDEVVRRSDEIHKTIMQQLIMEIILVGILLVVQVQETSFTFFNNVIQ